MAIPTSAIAADPDNRYLLEVMGKRLLEKNIISSYQIVVTDGEEVNNSTKDRV
jgi:hypothetical protein